MGDAEMGSCSLLHITEPAKHRKTPLFSSVSLEMLSSNLVVIDVSHSKLQSIDGLDLSKIPGLEGFYIVGNEITEIPGELFKHNSKMRKMNFSQNQIRIVGEQFLPILKTMEKLEEVDLSGNPKQLGCYIRSIDKKFGHQSVDNIFVEKYLIQRFLMEKNKGHLNHSKYDGIKYAYSSLSSPMYDNVKSLDQEQFENCIKSEIWCSLAHNARTFNIELTLVEYFKSLPIEEQNKYLCIFLDEINRKFIDQNKRNKNFI